MFSGNIRLPCSRPRSQQTFKISITISLDSIFWTAESFVTKLSVVVHHHNKPECREKKREKPECHAFFYFNGCCYLQAQSMTIYCIFWISYPFTTKVYLMVHHHQNVLCKRIALLWSVSRLQGRFKTKLNVCLGGVFRTI